MDVTYVGDSGIGTGSSTSAAAPLYTITAGSTVLYMGSVQSGGRTFDSLTDTAGGDWDKLTDHTDATRSVSIWRCFNHPGGTVAITGNMSGSGTPQWSACVVEGTSADTDDDSDVLTTASETNTVIYCAPASGYDIAAGALAVCCVRINNANDSTPNTEGTGSPWTRIGSGSQNGHFFYGAFGTALASARGGLVKSSSARTSVGTVASVKLTSGGGASTAGQLLLLGCGA